VNDFVKTKSDLSASADALQAFFDGRGDHMAEVGALVVADAIDCLRHVRAFLTKKKGS
jgi:hypothetical protein